MAEHGGGSKSPEVILKIINMLKQEAAVQSDFRKKIVRTGRIDQSCQDMKNNLSIYLKSHNTQIEDSILQNLIQMIRNVIPRKRAQAFIKPVKMFFDQEPSSSSVSTTNENRENIMHEQIAAIIVDFMLENNLVDMEEHVVEGFVHQLYEELNQFF